MAKDNINLQKSQNHQDAPSWSDGDDNDWLGDKKPISNNNIMYVDVNGYEGPLDLLLELARRQKVDLANISILALAEQYLEFIEIVRKKRIDIAADYLVVAAWLAYLKSALMLPKTLDDEPSGEMMAAMLQFRLKRLEAMRKAGEQLINRNRLGRQIFARGDPEPIVINNSSDWQASLYDLLKAYSSQRERGIVSDYIPHVRKVMSLKQAHDILERLIGNSFEWVALGEYLAQYLGSKEERTSILASSFSASLELVRQGSVELRQTAAFEPLLVRRKKQNNLGK
jgi:segregation and condensation protein A